MGITSVETLRGIFGAKFFIILETAISCIGFAGLFIRQTAIDSTFSSNRFLTANSTLSWSRCSFTSPFPSILSITSRLKYRGTRGGGFSQERSKTAGNLPRPISKISRKPRVVRRPTLAPFISIQALVTTVVPCTILVIELSSTFARAQICSIPLIIAFEKLSGVESNL